MNQIVNLYIRSMNSWQEKNIEMYLAYIEGKSVISERFFKTLKNRISKYVTSVSKNVYIDNLNDIVNKYNNTYRSTIKIKSIDVKSNTYVDSNKEINKKIPKFKIGDIVRLSEYKDIAAIDYTPNWSKEAFVLKKVKNTVPWTYVINDLNREEIVGSFYENELQKINQR